MDIIIKTYNLELIEIFNNKLDFIPEKYKNIKKILGGDFNITLNNLVDRWPAKSQTVTGFINSQNLIDIWRLKKTQ